MTDAPGQVGRRGFLAGALGAGAVGATAGVLGAYGVAHDGGTAAGGSAGAGSVTYPFYGAHQSGILTPAQDRMHFAAFDVTARDRSELVGLLADWTAAAAAMTAGRELGDGFGSYDAPPADTGEALGLPPSGLTITFGIGPGLFEDAQGADRFGLADRRPAALHTLPHFPSDNLDPARSGGDLCIQACADDPQVAVHAVRNLTRIAFGRAVLRWSQLGFGRTSSTSTSQVTPRNLFGFKDGTANVKAEEPAAADEHVWVGPQDDPAADWLVGGSYLVARRISMNIETWDRTSLREQETIFGRDRVEGAPLSGGTEFTEPDFELTGRGGVPLMAPDSHVRLAHPSHNDGARLLRRGYNFTDGSDQLGRLDAGLFFIVFVRDPLRQYIPMQLRMSREDALMEYIVHTGSGLWAVPPGATEGDHWAAALFA